MSLGFIARPCRLRKLRPITRPGTTSDMGQLVAKDDLPLVQPVRLHLQCESGRLL